MAPMKTELFKQTWGFLFALFFRINLFVSEERVSRRTLLMDDRGKTSCKLAQHPRWERGTGAAPFAKKRNLLLKADLTAVAEDRGAAGYVRKVWQIHLAGRAGEIAGRSREFSGPSGKVHWVSKNCE